MAKIVYRFRTTLLEVYGHNASPSELATRHIEELLPILPRGTQLTSMSSSTAPMDTYIEHAATLDHPFFEEGMTIDTQRVRIAWKSEEIHDRVEQDTLLLGVKYFNKDGSLKFA